MPHVNRCDFLSQLFIGIVLRVNLFIRLYLCSKIISGFVDQLRIEGAGDVFYSADHLSAHVQRSSSKSNPQATKLNDLTRRKNMTTSKLLFYMNMREPDAIIGVDAFGNLTRTTKDDFSSEEEFRKIKEWSDENYRSDYLTDRREENNTAAFDDVQEDELSAESVEDQFIAAESMMESGDLSQIILQLCNTALTKTQKERFLLSVYGYSEEEIGKMQGITQQAISKSIKSARLLIVRELKAKETL